MSLPSRRDVGVALAVAVTALVLADVVLQVWRSDANVPFEDRPDALHHELLVRNAEEGGWFVHDDVVGAPAGADARDFPVTGDLAHLATIKAITAVSDVPTARVLNAWFLLSFPAVAVVAFAVLRLLGTSEVNGAVAALLFAFLPYHFVRGQDHLFLATYVGVPLGCWLVLRTLLPAGSGGHHVGQRAGVVVTAVAVGWTSVYYAVFTVVLLVLAATVRAAAERRWRGLVPGLAAAAVVLLAVAVTLVPALTRRIDDGPNREAGQRAAAESETFALKLTQLVLPVSDHRIGPLAHLKERYSSTALESPGEHPDSATLGVVGTVGLLVALGGLLAAAVATRVPARDDRLDRAAGVVVLFAIAVGTVGGISSLVGYLVTAQVRSWGRISTFVAFLSLLVVARMLDRLLARPWFEPRRWAAGGVALAVLGVGLLDQTTAAHVPDYDGVTSRRRAVAAFVADAEAALPAGAVVLQLPYVPFPEAAPVEQLQSYDHLRPVLASTDLRWTFGSMRGRPDDWPAALDGLGVAREAAAAAAAGLAAVELDRFGFADPAAATAAAEELLGPPIVDRGDRWVLYDLRPLGADIRRALGARAPAAADAVLHPVTTTFGDGFHEREHGGGHAWRWTSGDAVLDLHNPGDETVVVHIGATLATGPDAVAASVSVAVGDAAPVTLRADADGERLRRRVELAPGTTTVTFATDAPAFSAPGDARRLVLRVEDLEVTSAVLRDVWEAAGVLSDEGP